MPYTNTLVPILGSWPSCVDPSRITARLWRSWATVDNAGTIRYHEAEDESVAVQPDGTFSFLGGPSFADFPVPIPAADGIGLRIDLPEGPIFRSGILDMLPQRPREYVNVFVLCEPTLFSSAQIAAQVPVVPFSLQDGCTTITAVNVSLGNDVINVSGTATRCGSLFQGMTAAFSATVILSPNGDLRDSNRPITVNVNSLTLNLLGGDVGSDIKAFLGNIFRGILEPWVADLVRGYLQNLMDALVASGVGDSGVPPGAIVTVRRILIRPDGIGIWGALGSFGNLVRLQVVDFKAVPFANFFVPSIWFRVLSEINPRARIKLTVGKDGGPFHVVWSEDPYGGTVPPEFIGAWVNREVPTNTTDLLFLWWLGKTENGPNYHNNNGTFEFHIQATDEGGWESQMLTTRVSIEWPHMPPYIKASVDLHDFGRVNLGTPAVFTFQITNEGSDALTISRVTDPADPAFEIVNPLPDTINPSDSRPLGIRFIPIEERAYSSEIQIHSNANNQSPLTLSLRGIGVDISVPCEQLASQLTSLQEDLADAAGTDRVRILQQMAVVRARMQQLGCG